MKNLIITSIFFLISLISFSQRDSVDAKNIEKTNEIHAKVVPLLTGEISNEDITILGSFLYNNRPKNDRIRFMSLLNPYLFKMNEQRVIVDNTYITQAFRILQDKKDVKIVLESVIDFHEELDPAYKKSDYMICYKIYFKDDNSYGKNVDNSIDFRIDVIDGEIVNIIHQIRYL
jgi:hypothetical protein